MPRPFLVKTETSTVLSICFPCGLITDIGSGTQHAVRSQGPVSRRAPKLTQFKQRSPNDRFAPGAASRKPDVMDVGRRNATSDLPLQADIKRTSREVRKAP